MSLVVLCADSSGRLLALEIVPEEQKLGYVSSLQSGSVIRLFENRLIYSLLPSSRKFPSSSVQGSPGLKLLTWLLRNLKLKLMGLILLIDQKEAEDMGEVGRGYCLRKDSLRKREKGKLKVTSSVLRTWRGSLLWLLIAHLLLG